MGKSLIIKGADFSNSSIGKALFGIDFIGVIKDKFVATDGSLKSMKGYDIFVYKPETINIEVVKKYSAIASVPLVSEFTYYDGTTLDGFVNGVVQYGYQQKMEISYSKQSVENYICVCVNTIGGTMNGITFSAEESSTPPSVIEKSSD